MSHCGHFLRCSFFKTPANIVLQAVETRQLCAQNQELTPSSMNWCRYNNSGLTYGTFVPIDTCNAISNEKSRKVVDITTFWVRNVVNGVQKCLKLADKRSVILHRPRLGRHSMKSPKGESKNAFINKTFRSLPSSWLHNIVDIRHIQYQGETLPPSPWY